MNHPQPVTGTPIENDKSTANDILTAQVRMKRSKAFDMRYHWIKDIIAQKQLNLYWARKTEPSRLIYKNISSFQSPTDKIPISPRSSHSRLQLHHFSCERVCSYVCPSLVSATCN